MLLIWFKLLSFAFNYSWELDETPEGHESVTAIQPVEVVLLDDEPLEIPSYSPAFYLMRKYSVLLDGNSEWSAREAHLLFKTFESIPQRHSHHNDATPLTEKDIPPSVWRISNLHIHNDISIEYENEVKVVTLTREAFTYAQPLLAEIDGIRGRYFSKRLHKAIIQYVTDNGADRRALEQILKKRYAVRVHIPNYTELTRYTTQEHVGHFQDFKNEELIIIASMLEELPSGMHKTQGLNYLVRRLDGTHNPVKPEAIGIAWIGAGYIEFMEGAFNRESISDIYRTVLHEKAHFLWVYLFDDQLKEDWIEVGGWYKNPNDKDGWSTTKQVEFVSAYAHSANPDEDMAESISFYITNPDNLRSRSPEKYQFIQDRVMHGTRYISRIREDLTFQVYNLYPDYIYPGRIKRINIRVDGEPKEDKIITIEIELHSESGLDTAASAYVNIFSETGTTTYMYMKPITSNGERVNESSILQGSITLSKHAAEGYWSADAIGITDTVGNWRWHGVEDFGWKLYIDNPLADDQPPEYVKDSIHLSLTNATTKGGRHYQILTVSWKVIEKNGLRIVFAFVNDANPETYSRTLRYSLNYGRAYSRPNAFALPKGQVNASINIPNYFPSGEYRVSQIVMEDTAGNVRRVIFADPPKRELSDTERIANELPPTIEIQTTNPDITPPVLDVNGITIKAEPTQPDEPNGETIVDLTFRIKDNISGFWRGWGRLRDPLGGLHQVNIVGEHDRFDSGMYFLGNPNEYLTYEADILLPVGSPSGTWGLIELHLRDAAGNGQHYDFTEIVRFEVEDAVAYAKSDVNEDGQINILDLVLVAAFDASNHKADVNGDGTVNILDLVEVASHLGEEDIAAPTINNATADQIKSWLTQTMQADDGSPVFRKGILVLQNLLLSLRPEITALLPNYPNPFNPETWIPYHLANASDVQITIYDTKGSVVRTLVLGYRAAGYYTNRDRAGYWDGRNCVGEDVSSGVYFYELKVDTISQLRKMVVLK